MPSFNFHKKKIIKIGFKHFWQGFSLKTFTDRHPYLLNKYHFIETHNPDYRFVSVFNKPGDYACLPNSCNIFYTGENKEPDMKQFDYAISFSLDSHKNNFRLPCWVPRLYENNMHPAMLLNENRIRTSLDQIPPMFCNFIYSRKAEHREQFFYALDSKKHVTAPGKSCTNAPPIGMSVSDKINFQKDFQFSIAFENEPYPGYITEKIIDSFVSDTVPIYNGDPNITNEFNSHSFININSTSNFDTYIEIILYLEKNRKEYLDIKNATIYKDNTLPDYANEDNIMAFFESIFG